MEKESGTVFFSRRCTAGNCQFINVHAIFTNVSLLTSLQETDKATIDVEAQEDGIMGKIIVC